MWWRTSRAATIKMTFLGNLGRVVAETLEVAGDEDEIDAGLDSPPIGPQFTGSREFPGEGDGGAVRKFLLEDRDGGQAQRLIP